MGWVWLKSRCCVPTFLSAVFCWNPFCVVAQEHELFSQPHAFSIRVPDERINTPYTSNKKKANWTITAWHIPTGPLSTFEKELSSPRATFRSQSGRNFVTISYDLSKFRDVTINQSGAELPCSLDNGKAREFDFFLHPNLAENRFEASAVQPEINNAVIGKLRKLSLYAEVSAKYTAASELQVCSVNQGSVLLALILVNREKKQTLFYQLAVMEVCGAESSIRAVSCREKRQHPAMTVFSDHTPFGVDDKIPLLGVPFLLQSEQRYIIVDVLPRIIQFIKSDGIGIDQNIDNWTVKGMTAGQNIWGNVDLQTRWFAMGARAEF